MRYLSLLLLLGLTACTGDSPTGPSENPAPACQLNNTAALAFENRSTRSLTFDVWVDSALVGTIVPGQTGAFQTVAAGVEHRVRFTVTNTNLTACVTSPIPVRCSDTTYYCDY